MSIRCGLCASACQILMPTFAMEYMAALQPAYYLWTFKQCALCKVVQTDCASSVSAVIEVWDHVCCWRWCRRWCNRCRSRLCWWLQCSVGGPGLFPSQSAILIDEPDIICGGIGPIGRWQRWCCQTRHSLLMCSNNCCETTTRGPSMWCSHGCHSGCNGSSWCRCHWHRVCRRCTI